ncbi:hypothetical protein AN958_05050 [Leucoagaricus sp. SymC.cos]|nr:hypothetical protein AN958_05050 [Leucoagaricus sp. SymC.cos]
MSSRIRSVSAAPQLGGKTGVILFVFVLIAFVVESQLTQYVQTTLHYHQPFFLFYVVHSSFAIIFPLHLLYLTVTTKYTTTALIKGLQLAITNHLSPKLESSRPSGPTSFPTLRLTWLILGLTTGVTLPAVLWFAAISLASVSDVTAIWNTNAFFAYLITVKLFGLKWEKRKLVAVVLATVGVALVVYGGTEAESGNPTHEVLQTKSGPPAPLVGNLLTLIASFGYGLYQVLYKIYAVLPSDPETRRDSSYQAIPDDEEIATEDQLSSATADLEDDAVYPPPFGFHSNLITTLIGIATAVVLWVFLPILHKAGAEIFRLPPDWWTVLSIAGIALSGVVFMSGLMVLLGIWGPIITSVGNLLTIVLVLISDIIFSNDMDSLTIWSLMGCGTIVLAFGVLAYDMFPHRS